MAAKQTERLGDYQNEIIRIMSFILIRNIAKNIN